MSIDTKQDKRRPQTKSTGAHRTGLPHSLYADLCISMVTDCKQTLSSVMLLSILHSICFLLLTNLLNGWTWLWSQPLRDKSLNWCYWEALMWANLAWFSGAFFSQRVYLQGKALDLEIWDTAGQERYHSVCHLYYRGASAALLVYDISSKETFTRAQLWLQELQKYVCSGEMVIALVGNKSDLQDDRKVSAEDAKAFAEQKRLLFMETSAKTGHGVKEVFQAVASELLTLEQQKEDKRHRRDSHITLVETHPPGIRQRCCDFQ
ncbi:ras-related protein Rab-17 isoform X1 [Ranitomeya variabilis]|uniref:ras-related protein Rab-17 isoform X1 n=1 Tax=Ranitomeya variabilis TaxID=490064 RepID=UPI004055C921